MAPSTLSLPNPLTLINPRALRSYILRLPLFTRLTLFICLLFYTLSWLPGLHIIDLCSLQPSKVGLFSGGMYRLNTFVFVHRGLLHLLFNMLALVPLMERWESEWGTLTGLALWFGPLASIPAGLYLGVEGWVFRGDTAVVGSSVWVFLLLGAESIKTYGVNPYFEIAGYRVPTWTTPLALCIVVSVLMSGTSLLGHLCGLAVGYLWGLGYIKFLAPPERALRWIEAKLNLLGRLPHYVSVDQKTYGRYGVLPTTEDGRPEQHNLPIGLGWVGSGGGQRLGP